MLTTIDSTAALGARDQAFVLLLSRLGLRAGEVAALRVSHVDWREGRVRVPPGKTGRERGLAPFSGGRHRPRARPEAPPRVRAERGGVSAGASALSPDHGERGHGHRATRPTARAHFGRAVRGPRVSHTVATHLVQHGGSMNTVADILGHAQLETTAIYAKLDVETLATVALPWPGGGQ